jgi:hypothetical protein
MPWVMSGIGGGGGGAASPAATFLSYAASAAPNILQRVRASLERWRATQGPGCLLRVFERLGPRVTHESAAICDDETLIFNSFSIRNFNIKKNSFNKSFYSISFFILN